MKKKKGAHYNRIICFYSYRYRAIDESNVMDAACKGAQFGFKLIGAIISNIVAFVSLVAFLNAIVSWLGHLVGFQELSFDVRTFYFVKRVYYIAFLYERKDQ